MEEQDTLKEVFRLTKENNRMIKAMRREAIIGRFISAVFWFAIIVLPLWYFYTVLLPQLQVLLESAQVLQEGASGGFQNTEAFREFLNALGSVQAGGE